MRFPNVRTYPFDFFFWKVSFSQSATPSVARMCKPTDTMEGPVPGSLPAKPPQFTFAQLKVSEPPALTPSRPLVDVDAWPCR